VGIANFGTARTLWQEQLVAREEITPETSKRDCKYKAKSVQRITRHYGASATNTYVVSLIENARTGGHPIQELVHIPAKDIQPFTLSKVAIS
jgi:hypothetical protein